MKKFGSLILIFVVSVSSCATAARNKKKQQRENEIVSVGIHRTVCFGRCPDYRIEIDKAGMATYTAIRFNDDTGIFEKRIGKQKAEEIFALCAQYRVDTCPERYENRIPDLPGLNMTITYRKGIKSIYSAGFGPLFLAEIAGEIDAVGIKRDSTWKKIGMPKLD
jgi:hypothetical protein